MFEAEGWAVICNGKLIINTVSDTKRSAIVNYLIAEEGMFLTIGATDSHINKLFYLYQKKNESLEAVVVKVST